MTVIRAIHESSIVVVLSLRLILHTGPVRRAGVVWLSKPPPGRSPMPDAFDNRWCVGPSRSGTEQWSVERSSRVKCCGGLVQRMRADVGSVRYLTQAACLTIGLFAAELGGCPTTHRPSVTPTVERPRPIRGVKLIRPLPALHSSWSDWLMVKNCSSAPSAYTTFRSTAQRWCAPLSVPQWA